MAKKPQDYSPKGVKRALTEGGRQRREGFAERVEAERRRRRPRNDLIPELQVEMRSVSSLRPPKRRLRKVDPAQVARLRHSIGQFGFCEPIIIRPDGCVVDGVVRALAAVELGLNEIPCVVVGHLSDVELRALRIALNRLGELGSWDIDELQLEFAELIELDAPIEATGFSGADVDMLVFGDDTPAYEVGPLEPDPALPAICQPGDVWALGEHCIVCGDARRPEPYRALFERGGLVRFVFTDVPYNVPIGRHVTSGRHREFAMASGEMSPNEFFRFNEDWISLAIDTLCNGGLLATFIDWRSLTNVTSAAQECGLQQLNLIVWEKTNAGQGALWRSQHELLPVFKKGKAPHANNVNLGRHGRYRSNVWKYPGASSLGSEARRGLKEHPTVKPTAMLEDALIDVTNRGDVVLDPFLGSGSTLIAAERTGRVCRGIEIDPLYVDVAIRRWMAVTGGEPRLVGQVDDPEPQDTESDRVWVCEPLFLTDQRAREA